MKSYTLYSPDEMSTPTRNKITALFSVASSVFPKNNVLVLRDDNDIMGVAVIDPASQNEVVFYGTDETETALQKKVSIFFPLSA
jgi:hypothetical protein